MLECNRCRKRYRNRFFTLVFFETGVSTRYSCEVTTPFSTDVGATVTVNIHQRPHWIVQL